MIQWTCWSFFANFNCFVQETQGLERITPLENTKPAKNKIPGCCVMTPSSLSRAVWPLGGACAASCALSGSTDTFLLPFGIYPFYWLVGLSCVFGWLKKALPSPVLGTKLQQEKWLSFPGIASFLHFLSVLLHLGHPSALQLLVLPAPAMLDIPHLWGLLGPLVLTLLRLLCVINSV